MAIERSLGVARSRQTAETFTPLAVADDPYIALQDPWQKRAAAGYDRFSEPVWRSHKKHPLGTGRNVDLDASRHFASLVE